MYFKSMVEYQQMLMLLWKISYMWKRLYLESSYMELQKYLASIIDDSVITSNEIIDANDEAKSYEEETKAIPENIN